MSEPSRLVLISRCVLDPAVRVKGASRTTRSGELMVALAENGLGVIQLPCPEMAFGGTERPMRTIEDYDNEEFRAHCKALASAVAEQVAAEVRAGHVVEALVGMEGSPTCGVRQTTSGEPGNRVNGQGIFTEELRELLEPHGVAFVALDTRASDEGVSEVLGMLEAE